MRVILSTLVVSVEPSLRITFTSALKLFSSLQSFQIVNPEEETSFDVVFLPRHEGAIENVLFVHSSLGTFTYTVSWCIIH